MLRSVLIASVVFASALGQAALAADSMDCCAEGGGCATKDKNGRTVSAGTMYQILFTQSGGIAGMHRELYVDTTKLKKNQQGRIGELVADTGLMKTAQVKKTTPGAADMFQYTFEVTCCSKTHKAIFDEGTLPEKYAALRSYLNEVPSTVRPKPPEEKAPVPAAVESKVEETRTEEAKTEETKTEETKTEEMKVQESTPGGMTVEQQKIEDSKIEEKLDTRE